MVSRRILPGSIADSSCEVPAAVLCFATRRPATRTFRPVPSHRFVARVARRQSVPPSPGTESPHRSMDAKQVWRAALGELQVTLSPANFETWLRDTALLEVDDTRFRISVPNGFAKDWLETRYRSLISQTLGRIVGYGVQVDFVVGPMEPGAVGGEDTDADAAPDGPRGSESPDRDAGGATGGACCHAAPMAAGRR